METMDLLENQEKTERTRSSCPPKRPSHASSAHPVPRDRTDRWDPKDRPDPRDLPASHHAMAFPANKAWLVNPDLWADQDAKVNVEPPETLDASSPFPDHKDPTDRQDHLESKDQKVNPAQMDSPSKVLPESQVSPGHQEKKADLDPQANLDRLETTARKARAIIAQSPVPHQAIRHDPSNEQRSGFRNFGYGTSIIIFCFIFTAGRTSKSHRLF